MFPWLWFWAPQVHFPWSGSVAQQIQPNLDWFFDGIRPQSGDATVEREAFDIASYGKQLGLISEALLGLSGRGDVTAAQAQIALGRLEDIREKIETVKSQKTSDTVDTLSAQLETLRLHQPAAFAQLAHQFGLNTTP